MIGGPMPEVGKEAPEFELPAQDGKKVELDDYEGKWVVLYFYPKDFTGGCTAEAKNFQADLAKYKEKNVEILGVSTDSVGSHKAFCIKESLEFKLAVGRRPQGLREVRRAHGLQGDEVLLALARS